MAKFGIEKAFKNKYTGEIYSPGTVIEMSVKRAKEVEMNLKKYGGGFIKRLDEKGDK